MWAVPPHVPTMCLVTVLLELLPELPGDASKQCREHREGQEDMHRSGVTQRNVPQKQIPLKGLDQGPSLQRAFCPESPVLADPELARNVKLRARPTFYFSTLLT